MTDATTAANAAPMPAVDRRTALGALAGAAGLFAVPKIAKAADPDPAFAAIARHKAAACALDTYDGEDDDTYFRLDGAERDAMFALADTVPTTHKGAYAALRYLVKEAGDRHYRVLGIFGGSLIEARWGIIPAGG